MGGALVIIILFALVSLASAKMYTTTAIPTPPTPYAVPENFFSGEKALPLTNAEKELYIAILKLRVEVYKMQIEQLSKKI